MSKPLLVLALASVMLAGCSEPLARTGETTAPVTLNAVWGQGPTGIGGDVLDQLVKGTEDAAARVVMLGSATTGDDAEERHAVEAVRAGRADLTVVRAGVLELIGAASLAPLGAPFVVTNNEQAAAIAADSELTSQLLAGLEDIDLVGIALVPGGLRHPFGYGDTPLLGPVDYDGQVLNVREDAGVQAILGELGASADHSIDSKRAAAAGTTLRGIEVSVQQVGAVTLPAVQTPDVTLYEKFDVVVVRKQAWDALTDAQRADFRASATAAGAAASATRATEEQGQSSWCATPGANSTLAGDAVLTQLRGALAPVTARLAQDADARAALHRMRALHEGTTDPAPRACDGGAPNPAESSLVTPQGDQSVLDGLWRLEVDEQALLDAGMSSGLAYLNAGVWEFRIRDGFADGTQPYGQPCNGQFAFDGDRVSVDWGVRGVDDCYGLARGTYRIKGDRVFFDWTENLEYNVAWDKAMFANGMVRIG